MTLASPKSFGSSTVSKFAIDFEELVGAVGYRLATADSLVIDLSCRVGITVVPTQISGRDSRLAIGNMSTPQHRVSGFRCADADLKPHPDRMGRSRWSRAAETEVPYFRSRVVCAKRGGQGNKIDVRPN